MTPVVVWSGGELLPPRSERTNPIYGSGFEPAPGEWTPEYKLKPKRGRKPVAMLTVRCAVCGREVTRDAHSVKHTQERGQAVVCGLPRKCKYRVPRKPAHYARLLPMAQPKESA